MQNAQIGLIGLGVMGASLARNIARNQFPIVVFNRTTEKTDEFVLEHKNEYLQGARTIEEFILKLERPRKIIILVKAGEPVDKVIETLLPHLDKGDLIIDCGNSYYRDTQRRSKDLLEKEINFIGCGISGGEEGALNGPSIMPGGTNDSWELIKPIFESIAAKDFEGSPCVTHIGENGAGHYVKMVHNGIEYAVMQMMADAYEALSSLYGLEAPNISSVFSKYQEGKLNSYLFEIAIEVLKKQDEFEDGYLVDYILDKAGNKGTGKWTAIDALERGVALPAITAAVYARYNSAAKNHRESISPHYEQEYNDPDITIEDFKKDLESALYAAMLSAYAEGYFLIQTAAQAEKWEINLSEVARIWEGGCIIRAKILTLIHAAYQDSPHTTHLLEVPSIINELKPSIPYLRSIVSYLADTGTNASALPAALSYFESMTKPESPANFIQGLRDYFGAHTYERNDRAGTFHTNWTADESPKE